MPLMLTLVRNDALEELLAKVPQGKFVAYLEGRGWRRREANISPGIKMWEFEHANVADKNRYFGGEVFYHCHVLSVPAPECFEEKFADVGKLAWYLVTELACLEQRSPVAVLCEIEPKVCDWLDMSTVCKSSVGS